MEIRSTSLQNQQPLQQTNQVNASQNQQQILLQEQKNKQAQTLQQVQKTPPPPDKQKGQTFSTYA
ncbi:MAG: hypothetical protein Fur0034_21180 [Desulfuromonadia bacterium]